MAIDLTVLRVFTDSDGHFGNPLGVVDAATVPPADRQALATELGYSETIFIDLPAAGSSTASARIFTPTAELPFAGHPTVGATWWLNDRGTPVRTLQVPAGAVAVDVEELPDGEFAVITGRADWAPEFTFHELASADAVLAVQPDDFSPDADHYVWAWVDQEAGAIRSRTFVPHLGVPEDEATGAAAVRITDRLRRDVTITQGKGSQIRTWWDPAGWVKVAGRVVDDGPRRVG